MTSQIIAQLTTSIVSIIGVVTTSIMSIRAHNQTTQAIINSSPPISPVAPSTNVRSIPPGGNAS